MASPLQQFFEEHGSDLPFGYQKQRSATDEFHRLCAVLKAAGRREPGDWMYTEFQRALVREFNHNYGTDNRSLEGWRLLCEKAGISPLPRSLSEARSIFKQSFFNLVDLTQAIDGREVIRFPTKGALDTHTKDKRRYFPRLVANDPEPGKLLKQVITLQLDCIQNQAKSDAGRKKTKQKNKNKNKKAKGEGDKNSEPGKSSSQRQIGKIKTSRKEKSDKKKAVNPKSIIDEELILVQEPSSIINWKGLRRVTHNQREKCNVRADGKSVRSSLRHFEGIQFEGSRKKPEEDDVSLMLDAMFNYAI
ncbi:hypothetical protein FA15DRAFT_706875 [Coprinopsis marcescibilis]|uniref:Uncharacterized protein n=1 Tax=Coprinopsis marcescibilis TaxID=230819 RepID=A0A5C3KN20_COPMA|nr:hypothetical protein FA15DRAFT_706875 [Coprinopsis marcescibilis]